MTNKRQTGELYDVVVERGVRVPTRDGAELISDIFRPAVGDQPVAGQFPVLLCRTPYGRSRWDADGYFFARRGYVQVLQDWRQTQGDYDMSKYKPNYEFNDGHDSVEWLAAQEWSNGKVGVWGHSANGQAVQSILAAAPPGLASAFVIESGLDYGAHPARQNGAFSLALRLRLCLMMARLQAREPHIKKLLEHAHENAEQYFSIFKRPHSPIVRGATVLALSPQFEEKYLKVATTSDLDDPFWKVLGGSEDIDKWADVPTCFISGWYGNHTTANLTKYRLLSQRLKSAVKLLVGHWDHHVSAGHLGAVDFGSEADIDMLWKVRLDWFDETLCGIKTETPTRGIEYLVMGGGEGTISADGRINHGGHWATATTWPPEASRPVPYYFSSDRTLSPTPPSDEVSSTTYTFDPRDPVPTIGGGFQDHARPDYPLPVNWMPDGGPQDQRGNSKKPHCRDDLPLSGRDDIIVFQTPPLEEDVTVSGELLAKLWVSSSAPDTDFTVKLIDVYPSSPKFPEGFAMNIQDAVVRMRYRNGRIKADLINPGEVYEVELPLHSTSNLFKRGHRIRIDVSSSNFPRIDVNLNNGGPLGVPGPVRTAENTIHHDARYPSHVVLPIVRKG